MPLTLGPWKDREGRQYEVIAVGLKLYGGHSVIAVHDGYVFTYRDDGRYLSDCEHPRDLVSPIAPEPLVSKPGLYEQRDGGVARVEVLGSCTGWNGHDAENEFRSWHADGRHITYDHLNLVRYIGPLDEPQPEPVKATPAPPAIDPAEVKALAERILLSQHGANLTAAECFRHAREFLEHAAKESR